MSEIAVAERVCPQCGTQLAPSLLSCPVCARLVHGDTLAALAKTAKEAADRGALSESLSAWREALMLLPENSKQHQIISEKITALGQQLPFTGPSTSETSKAKNPLVKVISGIGALGLLAWKFKSLALGLTKGSTFFSMLLSLSVYWTAWGWQFALGIVLSIYVHEMGHVFALRRYGFRATAPMFIPGIGALIRLQQKVVNPQEDAEIGLAGPIYGLGAALASFALWWATEKPIFAAVAGIGAWINLFNLLPIASLDGGRGFHAMIRIHKLLAAITAAGAAYFTNDGMTVLVAIVCFGRALLDPPATKALSASTSWKTTITFCALIVALSAVFLMGSKITAHQLP